MARVSVLLPVYNGAEFLADAVDSILNQTYRDFEIIAINDGSTDLTGEILDRYRDPRIRVEHQENQGLARTLNRALAIAGGELVARQDQDDLSLPTQPASEVEYLDVHPECGLVGTWSSIRFMARRRALGIPVTMVRVQVMSLFDNNFVHSSIMTRARVLAEVGNYPTDPVAQSARRL